MPDFDSPLVIEAALNGGRDRRENPAVPLTPVEAAAEAAACFAAGATVAHVHSRTFDGGFSIDAAWYAEAIGGIRSVAPGMLVSITSIRPQGFGVEAMLDALEALAADPATKPDLISVNLGHIAVWDARTRRTAHFPNDLADVVTLLDDCRRYEIVPELGVMDLGFVSNATLLRNAGFLPERPWFLLELDAEEYGAGPQVAPATLANYDALASALSQQFPSAIWAAHGNGVATYRIVERALVDGAHVRVGLEDAVFLPDGSPAESNAAAVRWAAHAARRAGRRPASPEETRRIIAGFG